MSSTPPIHDGAVDTPPALARRLAEELFRNTGPVRVLDPSCGTGELLLGALFAAGNAPEFAATSLYGIELNPERARVARTRILAIVEPHCDADRRARVVAALEDHIRCNDALDPSTAWPTDAQIIANPPWMSLSGRQVATIEPDRLQLYRRSWSVLRTGWPSLHGAFLQRIATYLDSGASPVARARVLIPTTICELERYGPTRAAIRAHAHLEEDPIDLGEDVFEGIAQPTTLLSLAGGRSTNSEPTSAWSANHVPHHRGQEFERPSSFELPTNQSISELAGERADDLLDYLDHFERLPAKSFADPGVHTGNCSRELVFERRPNERPESMEVATVLVGRDLKAFALGEASHWLRTDLEPTADRSFRIPKLEQQQSFSVLIRQTASHPIAALHQPATYFRNSLLACRAVEDLDPAVIVAVLNHPLIAFWHQQLHRDARQKNFPQVKVSHLGNLPFPIVRREQAPELHDSIARRVRELDPASGGFESNVAAVRALVESAFGITR